MIQSCFYFFHFPYAFFSGTSCRCSCRVEERKSCRCQIVTDAIYPACPPQLFCISQTLVFTWHWHLKKWYCLQLVWSANQWLSWKLFPVIKPGVSHHLNTDSAQCFIITPGRNILLIQSRRLVTGLGIIQPWRLDTDVDRSMRLVSPPGGTNSNPQSVVF